MSIRFLAQGRGYCEWNFVVQMDRWKNQKQLIGSYFSARSWGNDLSL